MNSQFPTRPTPGNPGGNTSILKPIELPALDDEVLQSIVRKIAEAFHPLRIILFGSQARGEHRAHSDVDLFVEMKTADPTLERRLKVRRLFRPSLCGMDILVYTPEEVAARRDSLASLVPVIEREGRCFMSSPADSRAWLDKGDEDWLCVQ